ncbi:MAG: hypothetical protein ACKO86_29900 [Dolichospermum sp.]
MVFLGANIFLNQVETFMTKRFNNLDAALKLLRNPGAGPDDEAPDAPTGSALREYQIYKQQKRAITYTRAASSKPGSLKVVVIKPFALPAADATTIRIDLSERAESNFATFGLTAAELGIDTTLNNNDKLIVGFLPAKAVCRNITGTTTTTVTSKLTKRPYRTKANVSFTFPFGRTTASPTFGQAKAEIISSVAGSAGNKSVTFHPEKY